jgi:magnesium-transporting ATPase (P-type)
MEVMTEAMHTIAHETKMEAANMRIITLVTLFFLPGTFVSVSVVLYLVVALGLTPAETLMSTPIVHYPDDQRIVNRDALILFLAISLPLLAITIITWYALYHWHRHKARRAGPERELEQCQTRLASPQSLDCQEVCKA